MVSNGWRRSKMNKKLVDSKKRVKGILIFVI